MICGCSDLLHVHGDRSQKINTPPPPSSLSHPRPRRRLRPQRLVRVPREPVARAAKWSPRFRVSTCEGPMSATVGVPISRITIVSSSLSSRTMRSTPACP